MKALALLALILTMPLLADKKPAPQWTTGKVLDSALAKTIVLENTDTVHSLTIQDNQLGLLEVISRT